MDRLTTAERAVEAKRLYGEDSPEYRTARESMVTDSQRAITEGLSRATFEYFPELEQQHDPVSGGYIFMGRQLGDMIDEGITPAVHEEEAQRRVTDRAEEQTYGAIRRLSRLAVGNTVFFEPARPTPEAWQPQALAGHDLRAIRISECADWAIGAYKRGTRQGFGGYVPEIQKMIIRGVRFDRRVDSRFMEQVAVPGAYYTPSVITKAMRIKRAVSDGEQLTKAERGRKQMLNTNGEGVLDFMALLDTLASEESGKNIFRGEVVPPTHPRDYAAIPAEAIARHEAVRKESEHLADFTISLVENEPDRDAAQAVAERYEKKVIFDIVKHDPQRARIAFDAKTADKVAQASRLRSLGDREGSDRLIYDAERNAPPVGNCGEACGIENVLASSTTGTAGAELLGVKPGETLLRDTIRACAECSEVGNVVYKVDAKGTVSKGCLNCKAKEVGGKRQHTDESSAKPNPLIRLNPDAHKKSTLSSGFWIKPGMAGVKVLAKTA